MTRIAFPTRRSSLFIVCAVVGALNYFFPILPWHAAQAKSVKKIVLIAGTKSHGPGEHEYEKGVKLLKHCLDTSPNLKGFKTEVYLDGWPKNEKVLEDAATILLFSDGSDRKEQAHPLLRGK